ncbi:MAG: cation:proton antiporter [Bacteroidaceae bacterium]
MDFSYASYFPITNTTWIFFVVLCIILFAPMILERLRIPHIIGMVLAGVLVGKYGFNVLVRDGSFELFGKVGLYYIMFTAGLGMDLGGLKRNLSQSVTFGFLTFAIPFVAGGCLAYYGLGYNLMASLLLACILSSHTLVAFPIVGRYGLVRHTSVTFSIGATMIALVLALLILAGISGSYTGETGVRLWVPLALKCIVFCLGVFFVYPIIIRWFFRGFADNVLQYIFVLALIFLSAAISELCGFEGIFGAFLTGLVLNRFIPQTSPLMNRIDFVGNALFIPYFLIGVGMLINVHLLFENEHVLYVVAVIVTAAMVTKWFASWLCCRIFRLDSTSGMMMFGLTSAHAAGALAMVMVGTRIKIAPGQYLMSDEVLNAIVLLILFSCIFSSLATEWAARRLALRDRSNEIDLGDKEKMLIAYSNPEAVAVLTNMALMMRNVKSSEPLVGVNVVIDDEQSARAQEFGRQTLNEAEQIASSVDVKMKKIMRLTTNVSNGLIHTLKEFDASEILLGLHYKQRLVESFFGHLAKGLLSATSRQIMILRCSEPVNTLRRIHVVVPEKAEYEIGFKRWIDRLARLAAQLDCRIIFHTNQATQVQVQAYMQKKYPLARFDCLVLDKWNDMLLLSNKVSCDHLLVIVVARRGTLSYQASFEHLPEQIERYFSNNSLLIVYPDQYGGKSELPVSFSPGYSKGDSKWSPLRNPNQKQDKDNDR